jgi:hypothetical protein
VVESAPALKQFTYARHKPEETVLYKVIQENLETFLRLVWEETGHRLPDFVEKEFREYLKCGILAHGFLRLGCEKCSREFLLGFSCKLRGFCPSCGGRRMSETAIHLVDNVLPKRPTRQWVISFPFALRLLLAIRPKLMSEVLHIVHQCISTDLRLRAGLSKPIAKTGAVTLIQRFGSSLALNLHFHQIFIDGVFELDENGEPTIFHALPPPTKAELAKTLETIVHRVTRLLVKRGIITKDLEITDQIQISDDDSFSKLQAGAVHYRFTLGPNKGKKALTIKTTPDEDHNSQHGLVAKHSGFSMHAGVAFAAEITSNNKNLFNVIMFRPSPFFVFRI